MNNFFLRFPGGLSKCLTLSYDDGVKQDSRLCELMKKHGIAGTFNINSGLYALEGSKHSRMTQQMCAQTYNNPLFEVATHALTHAYLTDIPSSEAVYQIIEDRRNIEEQYGIICRGHAYPYGWYSDYVVEILKSCGIVYARTTVSTYNFNLPKNWLILNPTCHHKDPKLNELADKFISKGANGEPSLFYLWGHSYEFDNDNNWEVIENFFEKVSHRDDTWYATNIEIYDYINAFKSLICSADGKTIYNPTSTDLWVNVDKNPAIKIPKGETVKL